MLIAHRGYVAIQRTELHFRAPCDATRYIVYRGSVHLFWALGDVTDYIVHRAFFASLLRGLQRMHLVT
jgi:hypothetical protein